MTLSFATDLHCILWQLRSVLRFFISSEKTICWQRMWVFHLMRYAIFGIMPVNTNDDQPAKPVFWVASSNRDLKKFPKLVRQTFGQALFDAQLGGKHPDAKPLKGFKGAGVLEVVEDDDGSTYRAVYTVKFAGAVYVLHAFQKKSKTGAKTPPQEIQKVKARLKEAAEHHAQWTAQQAEESEDSP